MENTHVFGVVVFFTLLDRLITVAFFEYEANAVVSALGSWSWLVVTGAALVAGWYVVESFDHVVITACLWFLAIFTLLAAVSNWVVVVAM